MPLPSYTAEDFGEGLLRLLPSGRAWPREVDAVMPQVVRAQGQSHARLQARTNYLLTDAFPASSVELLPEWEASVGLPDPCAGEDQTIAQRQAHVVARLTQCDGPSLPSLAAFAEALGYQITITEFAPARADLLVADAPVYDPAWAFAWQVNAPAVEVAYFSADMSFADEPLETFSDSVLACELIRLSPSHTIIIFAYS